MREAGIVWCIKKGNMVEKGKFQKVHFRIFEKYSYKFNLCCNYSLVDELYSLDPNTPWIYFSRITNNSSSDICR